MAKNKTTETENSVEVYLQGIADEKKRKDTQTIISFMEQETGLAPKMWGNAIVGFGSYDYTYDSGHSGSAPLIGLAARANAISLYLGSGFEGRDGLLSKFGKHKTGKSCIYIKQLEDIDTAVLKQMIQLSFKHKT
ncbi:MAG: DUF1801 domain-containing protein [bacterium]|nr:DUF1801 domain-containing protein [bacterium]